jgi:arylsulfatase A-like enzyme
MKKRLYASICLIIAASLLLQSCASIKKAVKSVISDNRPNFLIIVSDDQRFDTMQYMPKTSELIFDQGVTFNRAYITTPLCCPSRVSILTGEYAHNTLVRNNGNENNNTTLIEDLHKNGYYTGLVGKYLNSWKGEKRPEFDYWVSYFKGKSEYLNPPLNVNGKWKKHIGYITDILGTYSLDFLDEATSQKKPWILFYTPIAPHEPTVPFAGDLDQYTDLAPNRPPSFNEPDVSDKPVWLQNKAQLTDDEIKAIDTFRRNQILTLLPLDRAVGILMKQLDREGELDNTVVMYISDNGKFWGEHRIASKNSFYEEAVKVPFALRYPPLVPKPCEENRLVANIDIAPTVYELAGLKPAHKMDGLSLVGLLNGSSTWRDGLLLEGWPPRGIFTAWETDRYVYAETQGDRSELYDLQTDPYELNNLADLPQYKDMIAGFQKELAPIREPANAPTPVPE